MCIRDRSLDKVPVLAISELRFIDRTKSSLSKSDDSRFDYADKGAYHFLERIPIGSLIEDTFLAFAIELNSRSRHQSELKDMLNDVFETLENKGFEISDSRQVGKLEYELMIKSDNSGEAIPLQQASQGTVSVLSIFSVIFDYLKAFPALGTALKERSGIIFIDEIDAHLHPSWQQLIVSLLKKNFPKVQFIITAHSPMVVAGSGGGEVSTFVNTGKNFSLKTHQENFIGWHPGDIYKKAFELEQLDTVYRKYQSMIPFKSVKEKRLNELKELRKEGEL